MRHACGEPNEIDLGAINPLLNGNNRGMDQSFDATAAAEFESALAGAIGVPASRVSVVSAGAPAVTESLDMRLATIGGMSHAARVGVVFKVAAPGAVGAEATRAALLHLAANPFELVLMCGQQGGAQGRDYRGVENVHSVAFPADFAPGINGTAVPPPGETAPGTTGDGGGSGSASNASDASDTSAAGGNANVTSGGGAAGNGTGTGGGFGVPSTDKDKDTAGEPNPSPSGSDDGNAGLAIGLIFLFLFLMCAGCSVCLFLGPGSGP